MYQLELNEGKQFLRPFINEETEEDLRFLEQIEQERNLADQIEQCHRKNEEEIQQIRRSIANNHAVRLSRSLLVETERLNPLPNRKWNFFKDQ